jgi:hypothetical protein
MTTKTAKPAPKKSVRKSAAARINEIRVLVREDLRAQVDRMLHPFISAENIELADLTTLKGHRDHAYAAIDEELDKVETNGTPRVLEQRFRDECSPILSTLSEELTPNKAANPLMLFGQPILARQLGDASPTLNELAEMPLQEAEAAVAAATATPVRLKKELPPLKLRPLRASLNAVATDPAGGLPPAPESVDMEFGEVELRAKGEPARPWLRDRLLSAVSHMRSWVSSTSSDHRIRFVKYVAKIQNGVIGQVVVSLTDTGLLIVQTAAWVVTVSVSLVSYSLLAAVAVLIEDLVRVCQLTAQNVSLALSRWGQPKLA